LVNIVIRAVDSKTTWGHQLNKMPDHCIQLTADQRAFNVFLFPFVRLSVINVTKRRQLMQVI